MNIESNTVENSTMPAIDACCMLAVLYHGSFYSGGYDGMAIGAQKSGIETVFNCEINQWCRNNLKLYFPNTKQYTDATKDIPKEKANIISITSECQDISIANANAPGIFGSRSVQLFATLDICGQIKPDYIVIENSAYITQRGFEFVLCKLAEIGYNAEWQVLSLRTFGVQQNRERLYCIAYSEKIRLERGSEKKVFQKSLLFQKQFTRIFPGWRERSDIPEPRCLRKTNEYTGNYKETIKAIGNMVHPFAAHYLFECIKAHFYYR